MLTCPTSDPKAEERFRRNAFILVMLATLTAPAEPSGVEGSEQQ